MNLQQLTERVIHLEKELDTLRQEMIDLRKQRSTTSQTTLFPSAIDFSTVDKKAVDEFFEILSIQGEPIGIQALRQMMAGENLEPNELSRSLVEARDEWKAPSCLDS